MTALAVTRVTAGYRGAPILRDVSLPPMAEGEMLGLIGPNAAGKSTLMRCLAGAMRHDGEILLEGAPQAGADRRDWARRVGYMPQTPPQPSALTPYELAAHAARALDLPLGRAALAVRIETLFATLGLTELAFRPLHELSGGKRQLAGLALALIRDPRMTLLDEPTSALDLRWRSAVLQLVRRRLAERGGVAVAALHDLDLAARFCDRLVALDRGRVVAAGTPAEVLTPETLAAVWRVEARIVTAPDGGLLIQTLDPLPMDGA